MTDQVKADHLDELLTRQRELMQRLGLDTTPVTTLDSPLLLEGLVMLAGEVSEALDPLLVRSKPWKQVDSARQRQQVEEEVIDILFFWLEVATLLGWDSLEIRRRYLDKWKRNLQRLPTATTEVAAVAPALLDKAVKQPWWREYDTNRLLSGTERLAGVLEDVTDRFVTWNAVWAAQEAVASNQRERAEDILGTLWANLWPTLDLANKQKVAGEFSRASWETADESPST